MSVRASYLQPKWPLYAVTALTILALGVPFAMAQPAVRSPLATEKAGHAIARVDGASFPMAFVPNLGQASPDVRFVAQVSTGAIAFKPGGLSLSLTPAQASAPAAGAPVAPRKATTIDMHFLGAGPATRVESSASLTAKVSYYRGSDPSEWQTELPTYSGIVYRGLYPGINLQYEGLAGRLKGTYTVAPGSDPARISWAYSGALDPSIDANGNLHIATATQAGVPGSDIVEQAPVAWQEIGGERVPVSVSYRANSDGTVGFNIGSYDAELPLTIDPTLIYSSYFGSYERDSARDIATDPAGNIYLAGSTFAQDIYYGDVTVAKFTPDGHTLLYQVIIGGTRIDYGYGVAVDAAGNATVAGIATSFDYPLLNPIQSSHAGGVYDMVLTKLGPSGTMLFSTYLGGRGYDYAQHLVTDATGAIYLTGYTESSNYPTTQGAFQRTLAGQQDGFVTKINPAGSAIVWSTFIGGLYRDESHDVALDAAGDLYLTGFTASDNFPLLNPIQPANADHSDAFVTKMNSTGSALVYSTYLGGQNAPGPGEDNGQGIVVDGQGQAYVTGYTQSPDFPTTTGSFQPHFHGYYDAFVSKFAQDGSSLVYSTYVGGTLDPPYGDDEALAIAIDEAGYAYITGKTYSQDFPTRNAIQPQLAGQQDAFVTKLTPDGSDVSYSTYLGGAGNAFGGGFDVGLGVFIDNSGNAVIGGGTDAINFPVVDAYQYQNAGEDDFFISKIQDNNGTPVPTATAASTASTTAVTTAIVTASATATLTPVASTTGTTTVTPTSETSPTTTTATPGATGTVTPCLITFSDVQPSDYFYQAVRYLFCAGAISGYSDNTFRPYNNTTRGQLSKIVTLAELWTIDTSGGPHFTDVPTTNPFYSYIETAYNHGVISGYADGTFRWGNNVTRGQLSKIVVLAEGWSMDTAGGPHFSDVPPADPFYTYVETAYNHTVITGYADGTFRPGNSATRGQISKIVYNAVTQP